jgi:hypothetical protein
VRTQIPHYKSPARPQNLEYLAEHAGLVRQMMKTELTAYEIETLGPKRQLGAVSPDPGDIRHLGPRLSEHAERPVEADQSGIRYNRQVRHKLATGATGDIQEGQTIGGGMLGDEGHEFGVDRFPSIRLSIVKMGNDVIVHTRGLPHREVVPDEREPDGEFNCFG